jgi:hypothetical protein
MTGERQRFDAQCASFVCIAWDASLPFNIFQHTCKDSYTSRQICHVPSRAWIIKNEICTSLLVSMFCNVLLPSAPIERDSNGVCGVRFQGCSFLLSSLAILNLHLASLHPGYWCLLTCIRTCRVQHRPIICKLILIPVCTPTWGTVLEKNWSKIMTPNLWERF